MVIAVVGMHRFRPRDVHPNADFRKRHMLVFAHLGDFQDFILVRLRTERRQRHQKRQRSTRLTGAVLLQNRRVSHFEIRADAGLVLTAFVDLMVELPCLPVSGDIDRIAEIQSDLAVFLLGIELLDLCGCVEVTLRDIDERQGVPVVKKHDFVGVLAFFSMA